MRLLFVDTETGGTNPEMDALLEVALVVYEDNEELASRVWKIKTGDKHCCQPALNVNHIDIERHNSMAKDREVAAKEIVAFIKQWFPSGPAILAGHNTSFDAEFIRILITENTDENYRLLISYRMLDTASLLTFFAINDRLPEDALSLDGAFKYFGIKVKGRHTALGDVEGTISLFDNLSELL